MSPSPIRCRTPWKIHKRASEPDRWLDELGYFRKHTARDASCLFRAVSENVYNTQRYFHKVRLECVQFMASRRHLFEGSLICPFENYLKEMSNPSESGGLVEISAMSHLYRRDFVIFEANKGPQTKICNGYGDTIYLFYSSDTKHFDVVYSKEFINASSFCQSVVYEILYDGVYQLKDLSYAVDKMLHDKVPSSHIEYFMSDNVERRKKQKERAKIYIETSNDDKDKNNNAVALKCKHNTNDLERASLLKESLSIFVFNRSLIQLENVCLNCLNVNSAKDLLDNGITPFPYKVAKALDPDIYRNIEFDVWSELRREMRYGARYSDGTTLQVGVKCLCKLQPDQSVPYHCHIQEMGPDGGPCLVFIEELGEKRIVNYDQLEPLPLDEIRPWAPPYRYSRTNSQLVTLSQMLQQIGNMTRKQSAGKARRSKPSDESKIDNARQGRPSWGEADDTPYIKHNAYSMDLNFEPMPVEVQALPLMVDCRAGAGAPAHELAHVGHAPPNGAPPPEGHHTQQGGGSGDMSGHNMNQPGSGRASTPATTSAITPYTGGMNPSGGGSGGGGVGGGGAGPGPGPVALGGGGAVGMPAYNMSGACGPYVCGVKSVVWCAPASPPPGAHGPPHAPLAPHAPHAPHAAHAAHAPLAPPGAHAPPPPPHGVNPHVYKSVQPNGADLPMNDIPTLRYYFNLGVDCMWAAYGPPPPHPPPRHYSPRDLAQDMQQMSMHERGGMNQNSGEQNHKHKPQQGNDKPNMNNQNKNNGQRPLLGPRFKRGNDGNQNSNYQNKGYNNNAGNKGPNNRRNSHVDGRGPMPGYEGECVVEQPLLTLPYLPYPPAPAPPVYPIQYYPLDPDPGMMGMMGGMGYVSYDEGVEYGGVSAYYPAPYPPLPPPHHPHHMEHK